MTSQVGCHGAVAGPSMRGINVRVNAAAGNPGLACLRSKARAPRCCLRTSNEQGIKGGRHSQAAADVCVLGASSTALHGVAAASSMRRACMHPLKSRHVFLPDARGDATHLHLCTSRAAQSPQGTATAPIPAAAPAAQTWSVQGAGAGNSGRSDRVMGWHSAHRPLKQQEEESPICVWVRAICCPHLQPVRALVEQTGVLMLIG